MNVYTSEVLMEQCCGKETYDELENLIQKEIDEAKSSSGYFVLQWLFPATSFQ